MDHRKSTRNEDLERRLTVLLYQLVEYQVQGRPLVCATGQCGGRTAEFQNVGDCVTWIPFLRRSFISNGQRR